MIETERREFTKKYYDDVPVRGYCDECKKPFPAEVHNPSGELISDYYRVVTHHSNWGRDSVDSYESHDFCCVTCMINFIEEFWLDKQNYSLGHQTHEMEINRMHKLEVYE